MTIEYNEQQPTLIDQVSNAHAELKKLEEQARKTDDAIKVVNEELCQLVKQLEQEIVDKTGLSCVIGVSSVNVCSDANQPDSIPYGVDVYDIDTWMTGDIIECISITKDAKDLFAEEGKDWFVIGNKYEYYLDEQGPSVTADETGEECTIKNIAEFRFVRRP